MIKVTWCGPSGLTMLVVLALPLLSLYFYCLTLAAYVRYFLSQLVSETTF